jgi:transcriptional regulator with XRE-family HTH domain
MVTKRIGARLLRNLTNPVPDRPTQASIAAALGVSQQAVSGWINGHGLPSRERANQMEEMFGIPASSWDKLDEQKQGAA